MYQKCKQLVKADLHVHLNGLFDTDLIKEVLVDEGLVIPSGFDIEKDLNVLHHKHSLIKYLKPWEVLRLMPTKPENLSKLIKRAFQALKEDNVKVIEIRSSVIYLTDLLNVDLESALITLINEFNNASADNNIVYGLILTIPRGSSSLIHLNHLMEAYRNIGRPREIVALDLAGDEDCLIPEGLGRLFKIAKEESGLKVTIHAGETGKVENVVEAIEEFGADRIGHGTSSALSDQVMEMIFKKDICLEICPISNRRTGAITSFEAHPVKKFIENNVPFILCSDNPSIHKATLTDDYYDFLMETKRYDILENMYEIQKRYSFIDTKWI